MEAATVIFLTLSIFVFIPILIGLSIKDVMDSADQKAKEQKIKNTRPVPKSY